jgi:hypothetical protein
MSEQDWQGDLSDDCTLERYGMTAHAECMDHAEWWFGIWRGDDAVFNFGDRMASIRLTTGKMARAAAECVMEALRGNA